MALTTEDLNQINKIVFNTVTAIVNDAVSPLASKSDLDRFATKADLDRMESRLTTSMTLLERDTFNRLDQHEARITRLEQARP